jgi:hypothetical protein
MPTVFTPQERGLAPFQLEVDWLPFSREHGGKRPRCRSEGMEWIHVAQDSVHSCVLVNMVAKMYCYTKN